MISAGTLSSVIPSTLTGIQNILNFGINTFWSPVKVEGMTDERGTSGLLLLVLLFLLYVIHLKALMITIIIIISYIMRITCIFNMTVILTYSPPMTTDNGYYRTIFSDLFASYTMYRRREACACPISLSTNQGSYWYPMIFHACGMTRPGIQSVTSPS